MARRHGSSLALFLTSAALVAACSATVIEATTSTSSSTPTTVAPSPPTTLPASTTLLPTSTTTTEFRGELPEIDAEVGVPDGEGPFPAVVLVHGGGWVAGNPGVIRPLADHLRENGFLTVNTRYELASLEVPGYPAAVVDVACAVRYAAAHPSSDGTVAVIGHSAGAHLAALVALKGDDYTEGCAIGGSGVPDRLVGLAGPYDSDRLGLALIPFFGEGRSVNPDLWDEGNPQLHTDRNPGLRALIMYGELDGLVDDSFAFNFHQAILDSGGESFLELVEGARHNDVHDPALAGDLIVTWLER